MPIEIRELKIKGLVSNSKNNKSAVYREFDRRNSDIINSSILKNLKQDILSNCREIIVNELEKQNQR